MEQHFKMCSRRNDMKEFWLRTALAFAPPQFRIPDRTQIWKKVKVKIKKMIV